MNQLKMIFFMIWSLPDRNTIIFDLILKWPDANARAVHGKLITDSDPSAGPMTLSFAYFLYRNLCEMKIKGLVNRAARYMSKTVINTTKPAFNIIQSFLVLYKNWRRTDQSRGVGSQAKMMIKKIKGLNLDCALDPNRDVDDEKPDTKRYKKNDEPTIQDL